MTWEAASEEEKTESWLQFKTELFKIYGETQIVWPKGCDETCFRWFQILEEEDFRFELRYTREEIIERLSHQDVLFFFVLKGEMPEILVLGYKLCDSDLPIFYLDTIAVRQRGRGIGHIVMEFIIKRTQKREYHAIVLDTEETDEKNIPLQRFYAEHGFKITARSDSGDITMRLDLAKS